MAFQFLCPQGHLLQGDESQAGQQCTCPYCQTLFLIPDVPTPPAPDAPSPMQGPAGPSVADPNVAVQPTAFGAVFQQAADLPVAPAEAPQAFDPFRTVDQQSSVADFPVAASPAEGDDDAFTGIHARGRFAVSGDGPAELDVTDTGGSVVHIPCPNGHELETPREMIGQDVMCPHCQAEFRLSMKNSVEYKRQKEEKLDRRERQLGKTWLYWAIAMAVVVVSGIIGLIVMVASSG